MIHRVVLLEFRDGTVRCHGASYVEIVTDRPFQQLPLTIEVYQGRKYKRIDDRTIVSHHQAYAGCAAIYLRMAES